jgi:hypothetical protein
MRRKSIYNMTSIFIFFLLPNWILRFSKYTSWMECEYIDGFIFSRGNFLFDLIKLMYQVTKCATGIFVNMNQQVTVYLWGIHGSKHTPRGTNTQFYRSWAGRIFLSNLISAKRTKHVFMSFYQTQVYVTVAVI